MRKMLTLSALAGCIFVMVNCSPKAAKTVTAGTAPSAAESREMVLARYSEAQLASGKALFTGNCAKCHKLKAPETRTPAEWEKVLKRMIPKAKLQAEEGELVRAYVMANSKQD